MQSRYAWLVPLFAAVFWPGMVWLGGAPSAVGGAQNGSWLTCGFVLCPQGKGALGGLGWCRVFGA
jgi:hypothetical protein